MKLEDVLSPDALRHFGREFSAKVVELNTQHLPLAERDTYGRAFLQVLNLWPKNEEVRRFVFGRRLARIAARLLGAHGACGSTTTRRCTRRRGAGSPLACGPVLLAAGHRTAACTAWVPLQDTPFAMGPLAFARGSHRFAHGRDLPISDEREAAAAQGGRRRQRLRGRSRALRARRGELPLAAGPSTTRDRTAPIAPGGS